MDALPPRSRAELPVTARAVAGLTLGVGLLWWSMPHVSGATWTVLGAALRDVTAPQLAGLTALWILGLLAHSFVLTGALPGLTRRRALTLNLTGSAVASVAPAGGALGVAANWAMARAWHVRKSSFAAFTMVTNIWDVVAKLALPLVALMALLASGGLASETMRVCAMTATVALLAVLVVAGSAVASDRAAGWLARALAATAHVVTRHRFPSRVATAARILETRGIARDVITGCWPQLTASMSAYLLLQGVLLWGCLHVAGVTLPVYAVVAGFAVERLLTLVVLTPGGTGTSDWGLVATLVALGGEPMSVAVGALLYRGFIFFLEIPVGALWLGGWLLARRRLGRGGA